MADNISSYTKPLVELATRLRPQSILEIGIGPEANSTRIWLAHTKAHVIAIDKGDWEGAADELSQSYPGRFTFIQTTTQNILPLVKARFDFIYIDGDHHYEGVKYDIEHCLPLISPKGVLLLDDYGLEAGGGVNFSNEGAAIDGVYGVKRAADELLVGWQQVFTDVSFGNGARAYTAP